MITLGMWGNALALRLPSHIVKAAKLRSGMAAELRLRDDGTIAVRLAGTTARRRASVAALEIPEPTTSAPEMPVVW